MVDPHPSLDHLLPHRPPALLVTAVVGQTDQTIVCIGQVPMNHPCVTNGVAPAIFGVELAAQAAGILMGIRRASDTPEASPPGHGYLVSLRNITIEPTVIPADHPLEAQIQLEATFGDVAMFSMRVDLDTKCVVEGRLGLVVPSNPG